MEIINEKLDEISAKVVEEQVFAIIKSLFDKKHVFSFNEFYEICTKKLPHPEVQILDAFNNFMKSGIVVEGSFLTQDQVLSHEVRKSIYDYISRFPGYYFTNIISKFNIGPNAGRWHLGMLEKFNFIRSRKFNRYKVYFNSTFPESREDMVSLLRNVNAFKIYEIINSNPEINTSIIEKNMDLNYVTVQYYLRKLLVADLVDKLSQEKPAVYKVKYSNTVFLERYFEFRSIKLGIPEKVEAVERPAPTGKVKVLREYDYVGGEVRFKLAVQNNTEGTISKINAMITSTKQYLVDAKVKTIEVLVPNESRGIDFILTPLTCGKSKIYATVSYSDGRGEPRSITVKPKDIWIKCPLVTPQHTSVSQVLVWKKELLNGSSYIEYSNIPDSQAFKIALDQVSALDLFEVNVDDKKNAATFSGIAKVTNNKMIIEINVLSQKIFLKVWTSDMKQATGFLAYIKNLINNSLETARTFQVKAEKVSQRILDSIDISERVIQLLDYCDTNWNISDFILVLGEIGIRLKRSFPDFQFLEKIENWKKNLTDNFPMDSKISSFSGVKIQKEGIDWLSKAVEIAKTNVEMYESTFKENGAQIDKMKLKIENLTEQITKEEKKYSLRILKYLLVIQKESGLNLFQRGFFGAKFESDLISGFLTAIQSFGIEISSQESSMKKLVYKDFQIEIEDGDYIRAALILDGEPSEYLMKILLKFVNEFERKFEKELTNWTGNVAPFKETDQMIFELLELDEKILLNQLNK